jgi:hypothetical protein
MSKTKKKKIQEPMMKHINKPFDETVQRLLNVRPDEVKEKSEKDKGKK